MQSQDQKLSAFIKAINEYAEKQRMSILTETEEYTTEQLERAEKEAGSEAYRMINRETADVRSEILRALAENELGGRKRLFEQRLAIEEKVFSEAADRLSDFTKSDEYADYLVRAAKIVGDAFAAAVGDTVFRMRGQDMKYKDIITGAIGSDCAFAEDDSISIGGLLAVNTTLGRAVDMTLDSRLAQQRERFRQTAQLPIS